MGGRLAAAAAACRIFLRKQRSLHNVLNLRYECVPKPKTLGGGKEGNEKLERREGERVSAMPCSAKRSARPRVTAFQ